MRSHNASVLELVDRKISNKNREVFLKIEIQVLLKLIY